MDDLRGMARLWRSVFVQVLNDTVNKRACGSLSKEDKQAAIDWLLSNSIDYDMVLDMGGLSHEEAERFAREAIARGRVGRRETFNLLNI